MKYVLTVYIVVFMFCILLLTGCGDSDGIECLDGCKNRVRDGRDGLVGKQGPQGDQGPVGPAGVAGTSCVAVPVAGGANLVCGLNPPVFVANGAAGSNGTNGLPGINGTNGVNGVNCTVTTLLPSHDNPTGGATITCGVSSVVVINGSISGSSSAYTVVETIDACGPSGGHDEVFLRMANGALVAVFVENSSALTARLSYLNDGVGYQTTDSQHCNFSLSTNGSGLRTLSSTSPVVSTISWQTY